MDRKTRLLANLNLDGVGLEIGPLDKPLVLRSPKTSIYYADYASREQLQLKSSEDLSVNIQAIPTIDFTVKSLSDYSAIDKRFDYIIASHVIEHVPNFVGWLEKLLALLQPTGRLALAIPDKRYMFDYFRPLSTLGDALEAYFEGRQRPTFRQVFDGHGGARQVDTTLAWEEGVTQAPLCFDRHTVMQLAKDALFKGEYSDCHCWVFTYESFIEMLNDLNDLGILAAQVVSKAPPEPYSNEFQITLEKKSNTLIPDSLIDKYCRKLIRQPGDTPEEQKLYIIQDGKKRWVLSMATALKLGYSWPDDICEIPSTELADIPTGLPVP
jgi:SAM-dependent methyltransferase